MVAKKSAEAGDFEAAIRDGRLPAGPVERARAAQIARAWQAKALAQEGRLERAT